MKETFPDDRSTQIIAERYALLLAVVGGTHTLAKVVSDSHVSGFPHWSPSWQVTTQGALEHLAAQISQVEDEGIRELLSALSRHTQTILALDAEAVRKIAAFLKVSPPQTQKEQRKLGRKMNKAAASAGPIWVTQPDYQRLVEKSRDALTRVVEIKQRIEARLGQPGGVARAGPTQQASQASPSDLSRSDKPGLTAEPKMRLHEAYSLAGDQRASDLIDEAEDELDPRRAIQLLHRALRYGRVGVQASKAFLALGMRYEDLGQKRRAIGYYTKSMEAWEPFAIGLYWRGLLYYEGGKRDEARRDFEAALAFPLGQGLVSPEREQAESYLAELKKSSS